MDETTPKPPSASLNAPYGSELQPARPAKAYFPEDVLTINTNPDHMKQWQGMSDSVYSRVVGASPPLKEDARYILGLPIDYEGMGHAFALKYGRDAYVKAVQSIPSLNPSQITQLANLIRQAGGEYDSMYRREKKTTPTTSIP